MNRPASRDRCSALPQLALTVYASEQTNQTAEMWIVVSEGGLAYMEHLNQACGALSLLETKPIYKSIEHRTPMYLRHLPLCPISFTCPELAVTWNPCWIPSRSRTGFYPRARLLFVVRLLLSGMHSLERPLRCSAEKSIR
jgi:hypothetical protein